MIGTLRDIRFWLYPREPRTLQRTVRASHGEDDHWPCASHTGRVSDYAVVTLCERRQPARV